MSDSISRDILYTVGFDDDEIDEIETFVGLGDMEQFIHDAIEYQVWG